MRSLLVAIILLGALPALADAPASRWESSRSTLAFGYGQTSIGGPVTTDLDHYSLGVRVTKSDWATVTYGRTEGLGIEESQDSKLWEAFAGLGRMYCESRVCFAGDAHAGYQSARWLAIDDIAHDRMLVKRRTAFADARVALRLDFDYVWIEGAFAVRTHVGIDDDRWLLGTAVGFALYITP